jgi:lipid-binding SYLF domain-containing protein
MRNLNGVHSAFIIAAAMVASLSNAAVAQTDDEQKLVQSATVLQRFTTDDEQGIPIELLQRARGIAIIPNVIRGGFLIGGRRGRGTLIVRSPSGAWSNPAFITLTGGSIGLQFGAEAADVVLVLANDRAVKNIASGKFTLGGDASAVAGPLGRRSTGAVTGRAEVYIYARHGRGAFAGAVFEGARLDVDEEGSARFYAADRSAEPLGEQTAGTPQSVLTFLGAVQNATLTPAPSFAGPGSATPSQSQPPQDEARTFPLGE